MTKRYRIASVPADGIGPEVISAGLEVLDAVASKDGTFSLVVDHYDWGSDWYRKHGVFMPPDGLAWLRTARSSAGRPSRARLRAAVARGGLF